MSKTHHTSSYRRFTSPAAFDSCSAFFFISAARSTKVLGTPPELSSKSTTSRYNWRNSQKYPGSVLVPSQTIKIRGSTLRKGLPRPKLSRLAIATPNLGQESARIEKRNCPVTTL